MASLLPAMASSPCLTVRLPALSSAPPSTRLNSTFCGTRVLSDNGLATLIPRPGESLKYSRIRAENGVPGIETSRKLAWRGVPTKLNNTPHSREVRQYFYKDACQAAENAVSDGRHKLRIQITIPELNPEMDVYRIGTLLELVREVAFTFADDGKRVRVCVQGGMGEGIFVGMPLALAGARQLLEFMDWGAYIDEGTFIRFGAVGAKEVHDDDDVFVLMAPQNAVGNCIIDDLKAMVEAAGDRPFIIINPKLKDLPASGGVMQIMGRDKRMEFAESFFTCYDFRLMYTSGTQYPIVGAFRMAYPGPHEIYKRFDLPRGDEIYSLLASFDHAPSRAEISDAYSGRLVKEVLAPSGIWGFLSNILG